MHKIRISAASNVPCITFVLLESFDVEIQFALVSRPPILLYVTMESFINYVTQNYPQGPYSLS